MSLAETYIETTRELEAFIGLPRPDQVFEACAIDTEADSMHSYETKLCLIQFGIPGELAIIDPLAIGIENLKPFMDFVDRFEAVWMHGGDYDISMFRMTFNWVPECIFDTQIAARLIGVQKFGLASLLENQYGITVSKQSQKADWSQRPLTPKMLAYAYGDVRYLLDLAARQVDRLHELGRYGWFLESCIAARDSVLSRCEKPGEEAWKINGWGKLTPRGMHFLRTLWEWRDEECKRLDRPAFKFLSNNELLRMSGLLAENKEPRAPHYIRSAARERMKQAVCSARDVSPENYPRKERKKSGPRLNVDDERFDQLRGARNKAAANLDIEPTLIATRSVLERLASRSLSEEARREELQNWQQKVLEENL